MGWKRFLFLAVAWCLSSTGDIPPVTPTTAETFCSTSLAGYFPAQPDPLESKQQKAHYRTQTGRQVFEYQAEGAELGDLNYRLLEALALANRRFNETRPETKDLVFARQKKVAAAQTRYFVLRGQAGEATGMGMLIDGNEGVPLPVDGEFPRQDFRIRDGQPRRVLELARLATDAGEKGGLFHLFAAMAKRIQAAYGETPPEDLDVILWTSLDGLTSVYRDKYGFEVWRTPQELGCAQCAVLGLSARTFVKKFGATSGT